MRQVAGTVFGASGVLAACTQQQNQSSAKEKQVNIYSWPDYLDPNAIPEFEKRYGVKVVYDTVSSNEALLAKFAAGASEYDVVVPTSYGVKKLIELDVLQPLNKEFLPNFKNIMPRFMHTQFDPGCKYSVPYTFGTTGIAYNLHAFDGRKEPTDWDVFWDKRLKGRMTLLEDARETIGISLKRCGFSFNSKDKQEIDKAVADLKVQKPLTMCYTSDQVIIYLASGDALVSLAYSGDANQARRTNSHVRYIIPESGTSMWIDNMCIPKKSPHPDYAHLWINYMLEGQVAAAVANFTYYATPNAAALPLIKSELKADKWLYPPESILDRCEEIGDVGQMIFYYDRLWTELKCF
jgi:spermidine/putrescine transport system substrate-binding protein